jgi:hypothetical protein
MNDQQDMPATNTVGMGVGGKYTPEKREGPGSFLSNVFQTREKIYLESLYGW